MGQKQRILVALNPLIYPKYFYIRLNLAHSTLNRKTVISYMNLLWALFNTQQWFPLKSQSQHWRGFWRTNKSLETLLSHTVKPLPDKHTFLKTFQLLTCINVLTEVSFIFQRLLNKTESYEQTWLSDVSLFRSLRTKKISHPFFFIRNI